MQFDTIFPQSITVLVARYISTTVLGASDLCVRGSTVQESLSMPVIHQQWAALRRAQYPLNPHLDTLFFAHI